MVLSSHWVLVLPSAGFYLGGGVGYPMDPRLQLVFFFRVLFFSHPGFFSIPKCIFDNIPSIEYYHVPFKF